MCVGKGWGGVGERKRAHKRSTRKLESRAKAKFLLATSAQELASEYVMLARVFNETRWQKTPILETTLVSCLPVSKGRTNPIPGGRHSVREKGPLWECGKEFFSMLICLGWWARPDYRWSEVTAMSNHVSSDFHQIKVCVQFHEWPEKAPSSAWAMGVFFFPQESLSGPI